MQIPTTRESAMKLLFIGIAVSAMLHILREPLADWCRASFWEPFDSWAYDFFDQRFALAAAVLVTIYAAYRLVVAVPAKAERKIP